MKKIVALVLAMVMVLGLATVAFAAKGGDTFTNAKADAGWDYVVEMDDAEDAKDQTFATYEIEAVAKKDLGTVTPSWSNTQLVGVEKDDDFQVGDVWVKTDANNADFVLIDGKTVTYFAAYDELEWEGKAVKVTLPGYPLDAGEVKCNTLYNNAGAPGTFYFYEDELYVSEADGQYVFNVDGVAIFAEKANVRDDITYGVDADYQYVGHELKVHYSNQPFDNVGNFVATKVYCNNCLKTFEFVQGPETVALATFGAGNYQMVEAGVWVELIVPAVPGVSAATDAPAADATDKVESAETFDAGIAMYVGMSVMAAAGSAVVLKKKD